MTSTFIENESYKHKMAKEVLKKWLEEYDDSDIKLKTNYKDVTISFRSNSTHGVCLEYPIVKYDNINSIEWDWENIFRNIDEKDWGSNRSECLIEDKDSEDGYIWRCADGTPPSFEECVKYGYYPISIIDLVCCHKGRPCYFFEICHKNPLSDEKIDKLCDIPYLIEIDADWILNQVKPPEILKIKRLFIFGKEQKNM